MSTPSRDRAARRTRAGAAAVIGGIGAEGFVRFGCKVCPRKDRIALAELRARFVPEAGLVNILNAIRPTDCPGAGFNAVGHNRCGIYCRDLGGPNG